MTDKFKKAPGPEIILQIQKDNEVIGVFTNKIIKGLELFISPNMLVSNMTAITAINKLIYYGFTNYRDIQTLGEEFVYTRLYHKDEMVWLSNSRKLIFVLLKAFGPYLISRFIWNNLYKIRSKK